MKRFALLLTLLTVAACAPTQRTDLPPAWIDRSDVLRDLSDWTLNGRIGLKLSDRGFNGSLTWQQTGEVMRADFSGPFGAGAFRVSGNPDELILETGNGERYLLDDPNNAMAREFGWDVPLDAMRYWLIGLPHPGFPASPSFDPQGQLISIEQLGWTVAYQRYGVFEGWEMPRKLLLEKKDDVRIKLFISRWSLAAADL